MVSDEPAFGRFIYLWRKNSQRSQLCFVDVRPSCDYALRIGMRDAGSAHQLRDAGAIDVNLGRLRRDHVSRGLVVDALGYEMSTACANRQDHQQNCGESGNRPGKERRTEQRRLRSGGCRHVWEAELTLNSSSATIVFVKS